MTTLFLLVMGVCQSLNELGVVSVTKKWSGQNRTNRTACYGPVHLLNKKGDGIYLRNPFTQADNRPLSVQSQVVESSSLVSVLSRSD